MEYSAALSGVGRKKLDEEWLGRTRRERDVAVTIIILVI